MSLYSTLSLFFRRDKVEYVRLPHQMVGFRLAVWGLAIWYNTDMLLLLTAAILMMATTGTCLAQASLPAAEAEAYYATNNFRIATSADLACNDYIFTRTYKYVRLEGVVTDQFNDESNPDYCFMTIADDYGTTYLSIKRKQKNFIATNDYVGCRVSIVGRNTDTFLKPKGTRHAFGDGRRP